MTPKPPPVALERAVFGSVLLDPGRADLVRDALGERPFAAQHLVGPWEAASATIAAGGVPSVASLAGALHGLPEPPDGWVAFLTALRREALTTDAQLRHALAQLREAQVAAVAHRLLIDSAADLAEVRYGEGRVVNVLAAVEAGLRGIDPVASATAAEAGEVAHEIIGSMGSPREALELGIYSLDERLGGLEPGNLAILAAGPGCGKTALACVMALHVARSARVLFFELEQSRQEIASRFMANLSGLDSSLIRARDRSLPVGAMQIAAERLAKLHLAIEDRPAVTMAQIRAHLRNDPSVRLVVVDHLHLMGHSGQRLSLYERTTQATGELKSLAREFGVAVLVLCQLNRQRAEGDGKPRLTHLRDSGSIEQDADQVLALWDGGGDYEPHGGMEPLELEILKNRHGATGNVSLGWSKSTGRIVPASFARKPKPAAGNMLGTSRRG